MPGKVLLSRADYELRVERAKLWISTRLSEPLSLDDMAAAASFSKFHFHRVFTALTGESPAAYAKRLRLEKAANMLGVMRQLSVTEIGLACGFATPSAFARDFKARFGLSPRAWRERPGSIEEVEERSGGAPPWPVEVRRFEALRLAVATGEGRYDRAAGQAWSRLFRAWYAAGNKAPPSPAIGIPFDNPGITEEGRCRYSACVPLAEGQSLPRGLSEYRLPEGPALVLFYEGSREAYAEAYGALYGRALPESGCNPADLPAYEIYRELSRGRRVRVELVLPLET
jgi:AraC family transcriptional regulator